MKHVACLSSAVFIAYTEISCVYNLPADWLEQVWNFDLRIASLLQLVYSFAAGTCHWF